MAINSRIHKRSQNPGWTAFKISLLSMLPLLTSPAVTLQWDATPGAGNPGVQVGAGTWTDLLGNWRNVDTNVDDVTWNNAAGFVARFGLAGSAFNAATTNAITVSGTVQASGLEFLGYTTADPPATPAYTFTGGTIQLATGGTISLADNSATGTGFVTINSQLSGTNLVIQKLDGTALGLLELGGTNTALLGSLTLAAGANGGILLRASTGAAVNSLTTINVQNLSTFAGNTSATYTSNFVISGAGTANNGDFRGAIRVDGTNTTQIFTGNINLADADGATFNTNGNTAIIRGNITETLANSGFTKKGNGVLTLSGTNTYSGSTIVQGGTLALDFGDGSAPASDIITDGAGISLQGGNLTVTGKAGVTNSQTFLQTFVESTSSVSTVTASGALLTLDLGFVERSGAGALLHINSVSGALIKAANAGLIGAWSKYQDGSGRTGWAGTAAGTVGIFEGDLEYITGTQVSAIPGYTSTSNLKISGNSEGNVLLGAASTSLNSVTMAGKCDDRTITMTAAQTLRLTDASGIQVLSDAKSLTIGDTQGVGQVTAGTFNDGELILSNWSTSSTLTINAKIVDHGGGGALPNTGITINSAGNTILTAANTYTGITRIQAGTLEVRNNNALGGGSGTTLVTSGAALLVSGGLSGLVENITLNGTGISSSGALRNVSGNNTVSGNIALQTASAIGSTSGTLLLSKGAGTESTNIITGALALTFTGAGNIEVQSRIATGAGTITKTGNGLLILSGNNTYTGSTTVSQGTLRITNGAALGGVSTSVGTSVSSGATLEIAGGITTLAEILTLNGVGVGSGGALRNVSGTNNYAGTITAGSTNPRINADADSVLNLTAATAVRSANNASRTITFGGAGTINVNGNANNQGTGVLSIAKDGTGIVTLNGTANTYSGTTTVNGGTLNIKGATAAAGATTLNAGTLNLDFTSMANGSSNIILATSALTMNGGTLRVTGKAATTNSQTYASLTVGSATTNAAKSTINVTAGASSGTAALNVGAITRGQNGHTLDFQISTGATISGSTATTGTGGILLDTRGNNAVYATVNDNDWAAISSGQIVGGESVSGFYTDSTSTTLSGNADSALGVTTTTLAADTSVTSLRFDEAQATTINKSGTGSVGLKTGGILVTSDVGSNNITIATTTLGMNTTTAGGDLVIIQNNTAGSLIISAVIPNTSAAIALTKAGAGTLVLSGANTYTGVTRLTEGTIELLGNNRLATTGGIQLGGGTASGKLKLSGNQTLSNTTALAISGTGTDNRIVGGLATLSTLTLTASSGTQNFRNGFLGGSLTNENNLSLAVNFSSDTAVLQIGGANTYAGKTTITRGIVDILTMADAGTQSSLGAGNFDAASSIITLGGGSAAGTATLRYTGTTNSSTNRVVDLAGGVAGTAVTIQNNGTGTVKFTSAFTATGTSTTARQLTLSGSNTGINEIAGLADGSNAVTNLVKAEAGTWAITGASAHSGTTTVNAGTLLANNASGSATGTGNVLVQTTGRLGGNGFVGSSSGTQNITVASTSFLSVGNTGDTTGQSLNLSTSGIGVISLSGTIEFDIFGNSGGLNPLGNNDVLVLDSDTSIQITGTLQLTDTTSSATCWELGDAWQLFDWLNVSAGVPVTGSFSSLVLPTLADGLKWNTDNLYTTGIISIAAVPEPGRMVLLGFALVTLTLRRKHSGQPLG